MPRIIDSLSPRKGRPAEYDWDTFLDGTARAFVEGEDFDCLPGSFESQARAAAKSRGVKVSIRNPEVAEDSPAIVEVQQVGAITDADTDGEDEGVLEWPTDA